MTCLTLVMMTGLATWLFCHIQTPWVMSVSLRTFSLVSNWAPAKLQMLLRGHGMMEKGKSLGWGGAWAWRGSRRGFREASAAGIFLPFIFASFSLQSFKMIPSEPQKPVTRCRYPSLTACRLNTL